MSGLLTPDTFEFFATYLLSGYIVIIVRSRFVLGLRPKPSELVVEAVIFSLINQTLAVMIASFARVIGLTALLADIAIFDPAQSDFLFFVRILILPAILGLILGQNLTAGWKNAVLRRLALPVVHPVQRAHDFAFGQDRAPGFVIVTYHDGTVVRGYFGEQSLAATDQDRSDLYLEHLYDVEEDAEDQWIMADPPRSGLISLANVRTIEFLK